MSARSGLVAIGRNEGERLKRCLRSVPAGCPVVYVDSGSTDDSVAFAESLGMTVERLSTVHGFTAARARNTGWQRLLAEHPDLDFIQFVDGDCELAPGWMDDARRALDAEADLCAVFGRRRERFPDASPYNALCDDEWNVPVGLVRACGGDVLFRLAALQQVGGYSDDLIAGEEPDLCLRLGLQGWKVRRIDGEMTLHDADMHTAHQQWLRARRAGHAYAEHVSRHGANAFPDWRRALRSIILWGGVLPAIFVIAALVALIGPNGKAALVALAIAFLFYMQIGRISVRKLRSGAPAKFSFFYGFWTTLGKIAQFGGALHYHVKRWCGGPNQLIEYKRDNGGKAA